MLWVRACLLPPQDGKRPRVSVHPPAVQSRDPAQDAKQARGHTPQNHRLHSRRGQKPPELFCRNEKGKTAGKNTSIAPPPHGRGSRYKRAPWRTQNAKQAILYSPNRYTLVKKR